MPSAQEAGDASLRVFMDSNIVAVVLELQELRM
ncbi:hypothetical protein MFUL124B02_42090 [Myxococcus fulvus 124B02]|nr:hypothetical protein MFUL124B02_42090 [Myxococcus fulvus 124B02]